MTLKMSNQQIVTTLLDRTHSYLKSHIDMVLTSSFRIYAKVLSRQHCEAKQSKVGAGGTSILEKTKRKIWLLYSPLGYMNNEQTKKKVFEGQCAICSVVMACGYNKRALKQPTKFLQSSIVRFEDGENKVLQYVSSGTWLENEIELFLKGESLEKKMAMMRKILTPDSHVFLMSKSTYFQRQIQSSKLLLIHQSTTLVWSKFTSWNPERERTYIMIQ